MSADWSPEEVAATVAEYFVMLGKELRREPYNKREHNRRLQRLLHNRSAGAVEFKHANISAILVEAGFPYIDGYKPRRNYQELLRAEVLAKLDQETAVTKAAESIVDAPVPGPPEVTSIQDIFVPPPKRERVPAYERKSLPPPPPRKINYLEREARNASLGLAGELLALEAEHRRLWSAGARRLADKIEHVSNTQGDGLGFDILSYETDGRERLIEVKTTAFGSMTPFFVSRREVDVSQTRPDAYHVYRVFKFRDAPRIFALPGSLRESCVLDATQYRATLP